MSEGSSVAVTASYVYQGTQRSEDFIVTVQESDGAYCVSNAVQVASEEPSSGDGTDQTVDPQTLATDFLRSTVVERNPSTAASFQCEADSFTGITAQDLDAAISEWAVLNGETTAFLNGIDPAESTETSVTSFIAEVSLQGDLKQETYTFTVGVQGDCISSLEGGEGLIE
jgi:hypothetical protein